MDFDGKALVGTSLEPFKSHAFQLTVSGFDGGAMGFDLPFIPPGVRLHVDLANGEEAKTLKRQKGFAVLIIVALICEETRTFRKIVGDLEDGVKS